MPFGVMAPSSVIITNGAIIPRGSRTRVVSTLISHLTTIRRPWSVETPLSLVNRCWRGARLGPQHTYFIKEAAEFSH